jgi:hypothetical protein
VIVAEIGGGGDDELSSALFGDPFGYGIDVPASNDFGGSLGGDKRYIARR